VLSSCAKTWYIYIECVRIREIDYIVTAALVTSGPSLVRGDRVDTLQSPDPIICTRRCDAEVSELYNDAAPCWILW
jgi:hypothetical protein